MDQKLIAKYIWPTVPILSKLPAQPIAVWSKKKKKKKKAQPKSWEMCFIRQISEDVGPEDSLSDSSEGLLQRGEG